MNFCDRSEICTSRVALNEAMASKRLFLSGVDSERGVAGYWLVDSA